MTRELVPAPLTQGAFAPYGEVIDLAAAESFPINAGTTTRFHDLVTVELVGPNPKPLVNLFRAQPAGIPLEIAMMERHPLGSQAFIAMHRRPWLVVVAPDDDGRPGRPEAFMVAGGDDLLGVNYARNIWHHPLIALGEVSDFLVVDRGGDGVNLEEADYPEPWVIERLG